LDQLGSGVGNVIAILYVVMTARFPQVICIDEPNQFLHPKALRELLLILSTEGKQHQYILSAHSAEVIGAVDAATVTLLSLSDGVTQVRQTDMKGLRGLREGLAELGIRATELHGRDRVLWVEGQTEELVLPLLMAHFCQEYSAGTAVLRVHDTGEFDKRGMDPIKIAATYTRLSVATALAPPMVAIVLDAEQRKPADIERLEKADQAKLRFLPRRMLENYLLQPHAITAVLMELGEPVSHTDVSQALATSAKASAMSDIDLERVDGAACLRETFNALTDNRQSFRKTSTVPALVQWLLTHEAEALKPLGDWLRGLLRD
jgi:hypothetical protein